MISDLADPHPKKQLCRILIQEGIFFSSLRFRHRVLHGLGEKQIFYPYWEVSIWVEINSEVFAGINISLRFFLPHSACGHIIPGQQSQINF